MAGGFTTAELDALLIAMFHLLARMKSEDVDLEPAELYHTVIHKLIALKKRSQAQ
jgi:hypothetical protein